MNEIEEEEAGAVHQTREELRQPLLLSRESTLTMDQQQQQEHDGVFRSDDSASGGCCCRDFVQLSAMLSNFSTSYNVVNISMVLPMWNILLSGDDDEEKEAWVACSLLAGMMIGQVGGGIVGDKMGIARALQMVMVLQVVGSLASSTIVKQGEWGHLAFWRLVLGIGAGGVYPLAAVLSAQQQTAVVDDTTDKPSSLQRGVLTFSMQGLGFLTVPLVSMVLLNGGCKLEVVWRVLLGLGCVPGLALAGLQGWNHYSSSRATATTTHEAIAQMDEIDMAYEEEQQHDGESSDVENESILDSMPDLNKSEDDALRASSQQQDVEEMSSVGDGAVVVSLWDAIRQEDKILQKLLGTAATWFLFDVLFYGNTLFQPIVIEAAFGGGGNANDPIKLLQRTAEDSFLLTSIALPGYFAALLFLGKKQSNSWYCYCGIEQSPRFVMLQGFAAMALLYGIIGTAWNELRHYPSVLLLLYGLTFFFANYGPNTTTFVLPSLVYSEHCRATLNGVCAAAGKLGALAGASLFEPAAKELGDAAVMRICAGIALAALVLTHLFVPALSMAELGRERVNDTDDDDELL